MLTQAEIRQRAESMKTIGRTMIRAPQTGTNPYLFNTPNLQAEAVNQNQYRYARRGWPFASIRPIATRMAAQSLKVARTGKGKMPPAERQMMPNWLKQPQYLLLEPLTRHEMLEVVNRPNPYMVQWMLMWITAFSIQATGKSHWWFDRRDGRNTVWPVPSHWVTPGENYTWLVKPDGHTGEPWQVSWDMIATFYMPDAGNPMGALSALSAADRPVMSDDAIHESQYHGFLGGHMPDHAFIIGEKEDADGIKRRPELTKEQREELNLRMRNLYGGPRRHGRFILLDGLVSDVKRLTMAPTEMDYLASMKLTEREIQKIFGVNPIMMGEVEGANRASATVADDIFLSNVANPLLTMIGQVLTAFVERCPLFSDKNVVAYYDEIVARDPDLEQKDWQFASDRGMVSINDYRVNRLNLPPLKEGGDIARINITMIDVPVGKEREPVAEPTVVPQERSMKALYGKLFRKQHQREEEILQATLEGFFREQTRSFANLVENGLTSAGAIYNAENWTQKLMDTLSPALRRAAMVGAGIEESVVKAFTKDTRDNLFGLDGRSALWIDQYLKELLAQSYWSDVGENIEADLDRLLRQFSEQGMDSRTMADALVNAFDDLSLHRAQRIARTEGTGVMNAGAYAARQELAETGLFKGQEWNSILDEETRGMDPSDKFNHVEMDGQEVGLHEDFNVDGESAPFPGHYSLSAGNRCNCILPGHRVGGDVVGAMRSYYSGAVAEVVLGDGRCLSLTPNHPVLTKDGFVPAGELKRGDKVISADTKVDFPVRVAAGRNHKHDMPPKIEDVFQSLALWAGFRRVELAGRMVNHFHGDGKFIDREIDVVRPDWRLLIDEESMRAKELGHVLFSLEDAETSFVNGVGCRLPGFDRMRLPAHGIPSSGALSHDSIAISLHSGPLDGFSLAHASEFDASFRQDRCHEHSRPANPLRNLIDGHASLVFSREFSNWKARIPSGLAPLVDSLLDADWGESATEDSFLDAKHRNAEFLGDLYRRGSAMVSAQDVVDVRFSEWHGHVYDLSCSNGLVSCNGILTSNCRCFATSKSIFE